MSDSGTVLPGVARRFFGMWTDLLTALALVFVIEGIMPFINPDALRRLFVAASQLDNSTLRFIGLSSMGIGLLLLYVVRQ